MNIQYCIVLHISPLYSDLIGLAEADTSHIFTGSSSKVIFSLFLHNKLFDSKVNCNTLNSEKCKRKQQIK